ncbi:tyrosine-type recombinase/integrase [Enterococcus sp. AZ196]|uniref:tyrosine-type recombinase/integrase n=1 Tax=Enterococcus sp. AZ196 TaxID=2774659 RepID=UPI003D2C2B12
MGTIKQYTKKNGSTAWQFQTYLGINPSTGKPIKTTRRNFRTKKEAQKELYKLKANFEEHGLEKAKNVTFEEVFDLWFQSYEKTVKESTSIATNRYFQIHVLPILGNKRISKIDIKLAQESVNKWADALQVYKVIHQYVIKVFEFAINLELVSINPFLTVMRPKVKRKRKEKEIKFYTTDQVKQVLNYLSTKKEDIKSENLLYRYFAEWDYAMYRTLAFTGIRGGEALALSYDDLDSNNGFLRITKSLSQTKTGFIVSTPKTRTSTRIISVDDKTIRIINHWRSQQNIFHHNNGTKTTKIIFCDLQGNYSNRQALYMRSSRISKFVGLPNIGTHGWRHTHASMLYEAGIPMKEAQVRLGHASLEITSSIYTHLSEKKKNETADRLAKFANF